MTLFFPVLAFQSRADALPSVLLQEAWAQCRTDGHPQPVAPGPEAGLIPSAAAAAGYMALHFFLFGHCHQDSNVPVQSILL